MSSCFIDIHCHLEYKGLIDKIDEVLDRAAKANVNVIVSNGLDKNSNRITLELSKKHKTVKASLGMYPPDAWHKDTSQDKEFSHDWDEFLAEIDFIRVNRDKVIAIGEIGLDYKDVIDKELQRKIFTQMLGLGKELGKPLIIHSRKAEEDVIDLLEKQACEKVILHCFSGKKRLIERAVKLKYNFSVPTNVVRAENFQWLAKNVPLSQLFCETDSPFLSPFKEQMNEPAFVVESYKKIAEIKGMTLDEVKNNIFMNYQRVFC